MIWILVLLVLEILTILGILYIAKNANWKLTIKDYLSILLLSPIFFAILIFYFIRLPFQLSRKGK